MVNTAGQTNLSHGLAREHEKSLSTDFIVQKKCGRFFLQINRPFPSYLLSQLQNESAQNLFIENEFALHENELVVGKHFHMSDFVRRRSLKRRQEATRKWPITQGHCNNCKLVFIFVSLSYN